jgi:hypothetical protein
MPAIDSITKEVIRIYGEQDRLLRQLQKLAPNGYEKQAAAKDDTAMTWRSALRRLDDARECLDYLAITLEYDVG